jgi:Holliday junction resolvase
MGKKINSRQKGASYEREVANYLKEKGYTAKRGVQFGFGNAEDNPDVKHSLEDIHIECKRVENLNIIKAMDQAVNDCKGTNKKPTVWHRKNGTKTLVTMKMDDFLDLYEKAILNEI